MVQGICTPAGDDTTSELSAGNGWTGAPVKASMSDGASRNQGGTVEYFCIPPLIFQGVGFFIWVASENIFSLDQQAFRRHSSF